MVEIVTQDISRYGLHRLHLVSSQPIDLEEQVNKFVGRGELKAWFAYKDEEEDEERRHHLRLYWRALDQPVSPVAGSMHASVRQKSGSMSRDNQVNGVGHIGPSIRGGGPICHGLRVNEQNNPAK